MSSWWFVTNVRKLASVAFTNMTPLMFVTSVWKLTGEFTDMTPWLFVRSSRGTTYSSPKFKFR